MNNNKPYSVPSLRMTQVEDPVDPGFTYPDTDVVIPSPDEEIDPDFSVMPPYYPDYAPITRHIIPSPACSATITSGFAAEFVC